MGAAGGQGGRSGTGPGRCCSHLGSADSPQVPVPGLSPSTGRWELPASPQPPASAALAIYTRPGRHPSPGNPETQQQPRHWTHPSVGHIPPAWLPPWAALPGPGRPCSTTATELHGAQPQEPAGTRAPCPAPGGLARGSPSVAAPAPTGAALGAGSQAPIPVLAPHGAATTQPFLLLLLFLLLPAHTASRSHRPVPASSRKQQTASPLSAGTWGWGTLAWGVPSAGQGLGCAPCAGANAKGSYFYWESSRGWRRIWRAAC